jgi:hypothetical protein
MKKTLRAMYLLMLPACITSFKAYTADIDDQTINESGLQIVQVNPTPEPEEVELSIVYPPKGYMSDDMPIRFEARIDGFPVRTDSQFDRAKEIVVDPNGQSLHVIIDDKDYFEAYEALFDALDNHDLYYNEKVDFTPPFKLSPGKHYIRIFPTRSYGESLKGQGCFVAQVFYYKNKDDKIQMNLKKPFLTYNEPQGTYPSNKPVLLDFYVSNCIMSRDGYKVRLTIDDKAKRTISTWSPYYIYGLSKGSHKIKLELLDPKNQVVPGIFNTVEKTIDIK